MKLCECGCGHPAPIAARTRGNRAKGQPTRFIHGHNARKSFDYVEADCGHDTPCWVWQKAVGTKGYAFCARDGKTQLAHRAYYMDKIGPIPEGMQLDHLCRVRHCVNPEHLEPVTPKENIRRGHAARAAQAKAAA